MPAQLSPEVVVEIIRQVNGDLTEQDLRALIQPKKTSHRKTQSLRREVGACKEQLHDMSDMVKQSNNLLKSMHSEWNQESAASTRCNTLGSDDLQNRLLRSRDGRRSTKRNVSASTGCQTGPDPLRMQLAENVKIFEKMKRHLFERDQAIEERRQESKRLRNENRYLREQLLLIANNRGRR